MTIEQIQKPAPLRSLILSLVVLSAGPLLLSLPGDFLQDDMDVIATNPAMAGGPADWFYSYWTWRDGVPNRGNPGPWQLGLYRPLPLASFALETRIGLGPGLHRGVNIALHSVASVLLFFFLRHLLRADVPAWLASLWFSVHPALSDASLIIVGRADLLVGVFGLLALNSWSRSRHTPAVIFACLAALSKESGFFIGPMIVILDIFLPNTAHAGFCERLRHHLPSWAALLASLGVVFGVRFAVVGRLGPPLAFTPALAYTFSERLPLLGVIWAKTAQLAALPVSPSLDYGYLRYLDAASHWSFMAVAGWCGAAAMLALLFARGRIAALAGIALIAYFPVSNLIPIGALAATRFLYLPAVGLAGLFGCAVQKARPLGRVSLVAPLLVVILFGVLTGARATESRDKVAFWGRMHRRYPDAVKPGINFMLALAHVGRREEGVAVGREMLVRVPHVNVFLALPHLLIRSKRREDRLEALELLERGITERLDRNAGHLPTLIDWNIKEGRESEALKLCDLALERPGLWPRLAPIAARLAAQLGDEDRARRWSEVLGAGP